MLLFDLGRGPGHHYYTGQFSKALSDQPEVTVGGIIHACQNLDYYQFSEVLLIDPPERILSLDFVHKPVRQWAQIRQFISQFQPDLIHIVFPHPWMLLPGIFSSKPCVATVHDPELHPGESGLVARKLLQFQMHETQFRFCLGQKMREKCLKSSYSTAGSDQRLSVIPHGHFLDLFEPVSESGTAALFFGRISQYKGLEVLLEAWQRALPHLPNRSLIIAGAGASQYLSQQDLAGENVELIDDQLSLTELRRQVARSAVTIVPYIQSNASGVIATAHALGRAVIASDLAELDEQLSAECDWRFRTGDPDALAETLVSVLSNVEKAVSRGREATRRARQNQSWQFIAATCIECYRRVIAPQAESDSHAG